jgi:hypothetical protein
MKYIILPILKFIWALILTIIYSIGKFIFLPLHLLWEFNLTNFWSYSWYGDKADDILSPYWQPNSYIEKRYYFKSYYHYIWNIK